MSSAVGSGEICPERTKVQALKHCHGIFVDAFTSLPHGQLSGPRLQKMVDASVTAYGIVMGVIMQLQELRVCGEPTVVFEQNMATVRDPVTRRLATLLQTHVADTEVREEVMSIVSSLQPWTGKFVSSLRAGGRISELKLFSDAALRTFVMSKPQVRYFLAVSGDETIEEPAQHREKPLIVLASKRPQAAPAPDSASAKVEEAVPPAFDVSEAFSKANKVFSILATSKSVSFRLLQRYCHGVSCFSLTFRQVPRCEKDCTKLAKILEQMKAASATEEAVTEVTSILRKVSFRFPCNHHAS
jgi:hypothetical protein